VQAKIQARATVAVHSSFLDDEELRAAHFEPAPDIADTVERALSVAGRDAWVCVLPEGPQTIAFVG
jgi:nickel-dependent lactate racemase